jgi:hypothetical protein
MKKPLHEKFLIKNGTVTSLYNDQNSPKILEKLGGKAVIKRASHVEAPLKELEKIEFTVDLTPVGGPILEGFPSYEEAVDAEVAWIKSNVLK